MSHGKYWHYGKDGCRCPECTAAWREYRRGHYRRNRIHERSVQRERYAKNRSEGIRLLGGSCVLCGSTKDLEFDHIDPNTKQHEMVTLWHRSREVWLAELEKCQLLCVPCHLVKTGGEVVLSG